MAEVMSGCTEACWTPVRCPQCGNTASPGGCSDPAPSCYCEPRKGDGFDWSAVRKRHLWHEHDSNRWYTDPEGWAAHEAACAECRGESDG